MEALSWFQILVPKTGQNLEPRCESGPQVHQAPVSDITNCMSFWAAPSASVCFGLPAQVNQLEGTKVRERLFRAFSCLKNKTPKYAGTSGSTLLCRLCCCWRVRVHPLTLTALLLACPGPLSYSCCAAAGASGSTLLSLLDCCWRVRVRSLVVAVLLLARPGPLSYGCRAAAGTSGSALLWQP